MGYAGLARGLGEGIRTPSLLLPKQALYQVELHPESRDGGSRTLTDSRMKAAARLESSREHRFHWWARLSRRAPWGERRSTRRPGVPSGGRTRVAGLRIRMPWPASRWGHWMVIRRSSLESRPGIEPGTAVLQTAFLTREPARRASSGIRTRIDGVEARGPTIGRCPRERDVR